MPQPLESGIDGHQRGDNLHAVVSASTTGVNLALNRVLITGSLLVALLALAVDWIARVLEHTLRPKGL